MIFHSKKFLLLSLLLLVISGCQSTSSLNKQVQTELKPEEKDSRLTLNNATLEQSNAQGKPVWKIQVKKATYSQNNQVGKLEVIKGNLYENGQLVLHVTADTGEVNKEGEEIFLRGNITATDPRNGAIIKSEEVEWQPQNKILMVRKNLQGNQELVSAKAREGRYHTQAQKLELIGQVEATKREPKLQLKGEHFFWEIPQKKIKTEKPISLVRFKEQVVTDQATANRGEVDLQANQITIQDNIEYRSVKPPIAISTSRLVWNYRDRLVSSDVPSQLYHRQELVRITSNQTSVDLNSNMAYLQNGVQGINEKSDAKLYGNQVTWNIKGRLIEAVGNVVYEQVKPDKFNFTGDKAVGSLEENTLVVTGNNSERVVTEIFPE
jgi:LPS export ABC transporter protein LptC